MSRVFTPLKHITIFSSRLPPSLGYTLSLKHTQLYTPSNPFSTRAYTMATPKSRTYSEALTLLTSLQSNLSVTSLFTPSSPSSSSPKPDLNALAIPEMLSWLQRAGYTPSDLARLKTVHVAGTKGKGSVSALTASILRRYPSVAGSVGTYTSPHVVSVRERIMLDGKPISQELFARYFFELWDRFSEAEEGEKPFYFRFLTILAWHVFLREGVKSAVVECGIGGEYDATNVVPAEAVTAAVVTQLGIDHVAMLGDTVEKIAWHKAGIFKQGVKGITRKLGGTGRIKGARLGAERDGRVMEVLRRRAKEKGATLVELPDDKVDEWGGVEDAKLQGSFQKYNMALAVAAAREHLAQLGHAFEGPFAGDDYRLEDMPIEFKEGLKVATLRGRCEVILDKEGVEWYLDGAHTDDSLYAVAQWFASKTPAEDTAVRVLIFNQQERDSSALLSTLLQAGAESRQSEEGDHKLYDCVILCRNEIEEPEAGEPRRDLTVQEKNLAVVKDWEMLIHEKTSFDHGVFPAVRPAVKMARQYRGEEGKRCKVLVTGSFHLVGAVIKCIEHVEC